MTLHPLAHHPISREAAQSGPTIGATGTPIFGGFIQEDHLTKFQGTEAQETWGRMIRGESQISMILNASQSPIKSASFIWEHKIDQKLADFSNWHWFENPFMDYRQWQSERLGYLGRGFALHEMGFSFFESKEFGPVHILSEMGFRKQETIEQWFVDRKHGLTGVRQLAFGDTTEEVSQDQIVSSQASTDVIIKAPRISIAVLNREGDNYEGIPILRPAFKYWFSKDLYFKIMGIGIEKSAVGTPVGTYPKGAEESQEKKNFAKALSQLAAHQKQYILKPADFELETAFNEFNPEKVIGAIKYCDLQMAKTVMMQFLELGHGSTGGGSFALSRDSSQRAFDSLNYLAQDQCKEMERINKRIINFNFGEQETYPKCRVSGINNAAGKELSEMVGMYTEKGYLIPRPEDEVFFRETLNMPSVELEVLKKERESVAEEKETEVPDPEEKDGNNPKPKEDPEGSDHIKEDVEGSAHRPEDKKKKKFAEHEHGEFFRPLTVYEQSLNFVEIRRLFDTEQNKMVRLMRNQLNLVIEKALADFERNLKSKAPIAAANAVKLSTERYQNALLKQIQSTTLVGSNSAKKDLAKKLKTEFVDPVTGLSKSLEFLPKEVRNAISTQAKVQIEVHETAIDKIVVFSSMTGEENGIPTDQLLKDVQDRLDEFVASNAIVSAANTIVVQTYNRGRAGFFFLPENLEQIQAFQYSAVVDGRTTPICLSLDGLIFRPNDPNAARFRPPNHFQCRSILIPITVNEPKPELTGLKPDPDNPALGELDLSRAEILKSKNL